MAIKVTMTLDRSLSAAKAILHVMEFIPKIGSIVGKLI